MIQEKDLGYPRVLPRFGLREGQVFVESAERKYKWEYKISISSVKLNSVLSQGSGMIGVQKVKRRRKTVND